MLVSNKSWGTWGRAFDSYIPTFVGELQNYIRLAISSMRLYSVPQKVFAEAVFRKIDYNTFINSIKSREFITDDDICVYDIHIEDKKRLFNTNYETYMQGISNSCYAITKELRNVINTSTVKVDFYKLGDKYGHILNCEGAFVFDIKQVSSRGKTSYSNNIIVPLYKTQFLFNTPLFICPCNTVIVKTDILKEYELRLKQSTQVFSQEFTIVPPILKDGERIKYSADIPYYTITCVTKKYENLVSAARNTLFADDIKVNVTKSKDSFVENTFEVVMKVPLLFFLYSSCALARGYSYRDVFDGWNSFANVKENMQLCLGVSLEDE